MNRVWRWATWLAELLLVLLAVVVITASDTEVLLALLAWNLVALVLLIVGAIQLRRSRDREVDDVPDARSANFRLTGFLWAVIPLLTSLTGMVAAVTVVLNEQATDPDWALAAKAIGPLTMILAWLILHATYALRYAWWYARLGRRGFDFPGTDHPHLIDFYYFSFTLGTSFATSDVNITDRRIRWQVLVHSVLGFFYNAIVLAVAFKLLTGG